MQRHPWGAGVSGDGCAAGCAVQEGGRAVGEVRSGSMRPLRRSALCACRAAVLPAIRSLAMTTEAEGKLLGFRHTARRRLRRAVCEEREGAGVAGAGCEGAARASDAVSAPPSGKCEVVGRGHGRRTRERRWRGCRPLSKRPCFARGLITEAVTYLHFTSPRGYPEASTHADAQGQGQRKV